MRRIDSGNIVIDVGVTLRYLLYLLMTGKALVGYGPKPVLQLRVTALTQVLLAREQSANAVATYWNCWGIPLGKRREKLLCVRCSPNIVIPAVV